MFIIFTIEDVKRTLRCADNKATRLLRDGRKISIDCTGVEDALDVTMAQRSELDYLIYNDPLAYAELILDGEPEEYIMFDM